MTKATVHCTGEVVWEPPAIYKSFCTIDVEFFPFDEQTCTMKFGSWTYERAKVNLERASDLKDHWNKSASFDIDLSGYHLTYIWDLMAVKAQRNEVVYPCCSETFVDVTFSITIRRKPLFYVMNLIVPSMAMSFLTVLVFHLPSDSGEKITYSLSVLLALMVFFLLLSDLIPPTSVVQPLIGKYLLCTLLLVALTIVITVTTLRIHYRSPATHVMTPWVRTVFLHILPKVLYLERPMAAQEPDLENHKGTERRHPME